jgi:NADPH:quinone reductase-like Zn-dependent oxidoreductase
VDPWYEFKANNHVQFHLRQQGVAVSDWRLVSIARIKSLRITVQMKAAAINPSDIKDVSGRFKSTTLPRTPGWDFAGVFVKAKKHEGEEVWGSSPNLGIVHDGFHAEYVAVPAEPLSLRPKSLSIEQSAAIGIPFITAWASLVSRRRGGTSSHTGRKLEAGANPEAAFTKTGR